ncbi:MAG TPA: GAF domain-containing sensor histidine kinase [Candidatus Saccharimonadales bacterium]|nr:GAF domain-containing sensor histidine kinase [Candidatus Saccharimonadales bacterium]
MQVGIPSPDKPARKFRGRQQLKQDLEHVTQEMYQRNRELAETNKTLSLLESVDGLVLDASQPLEEVCNKIAGALTETTDCPFIAVFVKDDGHDDLILDGVSVKERPDKHQLPGMTRPVRINLQDPVIKDLPHSRVIDLVNSDSMNLCEILHCTKDQADKILSEVPIKSAYFVKLSARQKVVGAILAGFYSTADQLTDSDTLLLNRVSESVGVALDNKILAEENSRVLRQLKKSNTKLRLLDQTKDDFISMASHQLRTPLTSVKGYLSLVIDGDAGEISDSQRKLLTQAFFSSQRMVFLIADLLNVSRLKTGKFIIERTFVNLAEIIEQELAQLVETAKGRDLTLEYKKPANFPSLNIDETKTRQVIMNFCDNAIYYTPAGGHIIVQLENLEKSIEWKVIDNGIGVPKADQHHLFGKFYRAKNAQKARPDGTGLGLYMAKKIIVAQGGAIIFKSKPGKGSTFGFTFPKAGITEPTPTEQVTPKMFEEKKGYGLKKDR